MGRRCLTKRLLKHSAEDMSRRLFYGDGARTRFGKQGITYIIEDLKGSSIILYDEKTRTSVIAERSQKYTTQCSKLGKIQMTFQQ